VLRPQLYCSFRERHSHNPTARPAMRCRTREARPDRLVLPAIRRVTRCRIRGPRLALPALRDTRRVIAARRAAPGPWGRDPRLLERQDQPRTGRDRQAEADNHRKARHSKGGVAGVFVVTCDAASFSSSSFSTRASSSCPST